MTANRFFVPNTEEFFEGLVVLLRQCGLCCQENSDGGLAEFLGRRVEEYQRTLGGRHYWCSVALENGVDQKLSSHFLIYKSSILNYITSNLTFEVHVIRTLNS